MTTYRYRAVDTQGREVSGVMQATDEYTAVLKIRAKYPIITQISEINEKHGLLSMEIGGTAKVSPQKLSLMCSQFGTMLKSGFPVARCIDLISDQTQDRKLKVMLKSVSEDVSQGVSVAAAFEKNGKGAFPVTFIETVRAGEASGTLENSFDKMKEYYEKAYKNQEKIKQVMTYPIFVVIVAVIVLIVVMAKVIPTLAATFGELGGDLPLMTKVMIDVSNFFAKWWILFIIVILAVILVLAIYFKTDKGSLVKGKLLLKMPGIGPIATMNSAAQYADTMSAMLSSGLPVNKALEVTSKVMDNEVYSREIHRISEEVEEGKSLGACMKNVEYFPEQLKQMTAIGEESGELENTLQIIGEFYNNEADHLTQQAINKLEPTIMVILAVFAGFIVISIYLPMFTMYNLM